MEAKIMSEWMMKIYDPRTDRIRYVYSVCDLCNLGEHVEGHYMCMGMAEKEAVKLGYEVLYRKLNFWENMGDS
jgi:hypothetical protein